MYYIQSKVVLMEQDNRPKKTEDGVDYLEPSYTVVNPDGTVYWETKEKVDRNREYLKVGEYTPNNLGVNEQMVDNFIKEYKVLDLGEKTTCVVATLVNGYEITETSACVSKDNYNQDIGKDICIRAIKDKVWELLGFLLQTAIWSSNKEENK